MDNCEERQKALDGKLDLKFKEVFSMLTSIEKKVDEGIKDIAKQIATHAIEIAVLKERSSHHRKDDVV